MKWSLWLVAAIALWAAFIVWSIRTFWRTSDDARQARIYGVTKFVTIAETLGFALYLPLALSIPDGSYLLKATYWAFVSFPIVLCFNCWGARVFAAIVDSHR